MRARDVVGKRIVRVVQHPIDSGLSCIGTGRRSVPVWDLDYIELDDGSLMVFTAVETSFGEHLIQSSVVKRKRPKRNPKRETP